MDEAQIAGFLLRRTPSGLRTMYMYRNAECGLIGRIGLDCCKGQESGAKGRKVRETVIMARH